jgi:hypothetical protein
MPDFLGYTSRFVKKLRNSDECIKQMKMESEEKTGDVIIIHEILYGWCWFMTLRLREFLVYDNLVLWQPINSISLILAIPDTLP